MPNSFSRPQLVLVRTASSVFTAAARALIASVGIGWTFPSATAASWRRRKSGLLSSAMSRETFGGRGDARLHPAAAAIVAKISSAAKMRPAMFFQRRARLAVQVRRCCSCRRLRIRLSNGSSRNADIGLVS